MMSRLGDASHPPPIQTPPPIYQQLPNVPCSLSVKLLGGTDPRRRHLQANLAAFRKEDVNGLLRVPGELTLHTLDVLVRLRLELGGGVATRPPYKSLRSDTWHELHDASNRYGYVIERPQDSPLALAFLSKASCCSSL